MTPLDVLAYFAAVATGGALCGLSAVLVFALFVKLMERM